MADALAFAIFPTALGACAIAWSARGLTRVWLPEASPESLRRAVVRRVAGARETPPRGAVADAVAAIIRLLAGEHVDLRGVAVDDGACAEFDRRVYAVAREIDAGRVLTYGEVAARVGDGATARAVGASLGRNATPLVVPCHRVVAAEGLGGFSAPGGARTKRRLLAIEDARPSGAPGLFDAPLPARAPGAAAQVASCGPIGVAAPASAGSLMEPSGRS